MGVGGVCTVFSALHSQVGKKTKLRGKIGHPEPHTLHPYFSENLAPQQRIGLGSGPWWVIFTAFSYHICIFKNSSAEWIPFSLSLLQKVGCILQNVAVD